MTGADHDAEPPLEDVRHALRERVKELSCLYDVSAILADASRHHDQRMQALVDRLPRGWQHTTLAAARLQIDGESWQTAGWRPSPLLQEAEVEVAGQAVGRLEVAYVRQPDGAATAAFLPEEGLLLTELSHRIGTYLEQEWGRQRSRSLEEKLRDGRRPPREAGTPRHGLLGDSPAMHGVHAAIDRAARTDATILILGESGTGKELVARAIHYASHRSTAPFVPVNCAAIPENLVESELFGYVKGAFTGATHSRAGFLQTAQGGTVFLDEVAEMSLAVQAKLLRVLEDNEIRMVGSDRLVRADLRIVAATNQDIVAQVKAGRFRADLYFRLNVLSIELPPLRERGDDLMQLLEVFQERFGASTGGRPLAFSERALRVLRGHDWPGNVRELENLVHRLSVMVDSGYVDVADLPGAIRSATPREATDLRPLAEVERDHIQQVLRAVDGNRSRAAQILGIDRKTLRKRLDDGAADRRDPFT